MTVTNIPQKSIVRQSTKPTAPQAGLLWYDTSTDILKQYKNGSFQTVSSSPDGITINKNNSGEIQNFQDVDIIGDFENDTGGWSTSTNAPTYEAVTSTNFSLRGSYSLKLRANPRYSGESTAKISVDLTDYGLLRLPYRFDHNVSGSLSNADAEIRVDGNLVINKFNISNTDWKVINYDVSGISGSTEIKYEANSFGGGADEYFSVYLDDVRRKTSGKIVNQNVLPEAGN